MITASELIQTSETDEISLSTALKNAVEEYFWTSPEGEQIECPYLRNGGPCRPEPQVLNKPGGGKATSAEFQIAAEHAYKQLVPKEFEHPKSIAAAVRRGLVEGGLPIEEHNYTGVDCSGFVTQALARGLKTLGADLYGELIIPGWLGVRFVQDRLHSSPEDRDKASQLYDAIYGYEPLRLSSYRDILGFDAHPARNVNAEILLGNTVQIHDEDIQPGDIVQFASGHGINATKHPVLVLGDAGNGRKTLAHSTRISHYADIGGIEYFEMAADELFDSKRRYHNLGYPTVRRLAILTL